MVVWFGWLMMEPGSCWMQRMINLVTVNCLPKASTFTSGRNLVGLCSPYKILGLESRRKYLFYTMIAFVCKASGKRSPKKRRSQNNVPLELETTSKKIFEDKQAQPEVPLPLDANYVDVPPSTVSIPSRAAVLQACTLTSGLIGALGVLIRQVSHVASVEGLPILDCTMEVSFSTETWHLELIIGLVILISSCRYLLLKMWPEFSESSRAANEQVLTSLEPLDYVVVSFLPGISEELLFRGALQPLFGMDWRSILAVAILFGALHLGSGRKYAFAVWATFVGSMYGFATISSSSIIVPMASHAVNNLVGGILWRYTSTSPD